MSSTGRIKQEAQDASVPDTAAKHASPASEKDKPAKRQKKESGSTSVRVIGVARSISACQRCRLKKTKCDQQFPSCSICKKAGEPCVGIDAATGRIVPRSYVCHLEERVAQLESKLKENGVDLGSLDSPGSLASNGSSPSFSPIVKTVNKAKSQVIDAISESVLEVGTDQQQEDSPPADGRTAANTDDAKKPEKLASFLGASAGLSFSRLLFTAVNGGKDFMSRPARMAADSASAINTAEELKNVRPAKLPKKAVAEEFLSHFFSQANSQMPILHREQFIKKYFEPIYGKLSEGVSLASDYTTLGLQLQGPNEPPDPNAYYYKYSKAREDAADSPMSAPTFGPEPHPFSLNEELGDPNVCLYYLNIVFAIATSVLQQQYSIKISEAYRKSAAHHFKAVLSSASRIDTLQSLLLLALYSIMRPASPGVWYVMGSAMRICVDLGLHNETGMRSWQKSRQATPSDPNVPSTSILQFEQKFDPAMVDMRRRLFWCTYALDRQISVYLGRPFGIPEESVKVPFPSELDDSLINSNSHLADFSRQSVRVLSYKSVSLSFFRLRIIQAEIQRVLYDCAPLPRWFDSLKDWKEQRSQKLEDWYASCPKAIKKMNCSFNVEFFALNYHQTRILLHGLSPASSSLTVGSYMTLADAGQQVIKTYYSLHERKLINYSWVAVHNLMTSGASYLYALYNSLDVRQSTTLAVVQETVLQCIEVLGGMIDRCDAAEGCRNSFEILGAAILRLYYNEQNGRHNSQSSQLSGAANAQNGYFMNSHVYRNADRPNLIRPVTSVSAGDTVNTPVSLVPQQAKAKEEERVKDQLQAYPGVIVQNGSDGANNSAGIDSGAMDQDLAAWMSESGFDTSNFYDLNGFLREAAELEGISPTSNRNGIVDQDSNGGMSMSPGFLDSYYTQDAENAGSRKNESQRIFDIIQEGSLAPIWDQFFAVPQQGLGGNDNNFQL